jgi:hypothetical protein
VSSKGGQRWYSKRLCTYLTAELQLVITIFSGDFCGANPAITISGDPECSMLVEPGIVPSYFDRAGDE